MRKYEDPQKEERSQREGTQALITCLLRATQERKSTEYVSPSGLETFINKNGTWKERLCGRIGASEVIDLLAPYVTDGLVEQVTIYGATANHPVNGYRPNGERIRELRHIAQGYEKK